MILYTKNNIPENLKWSSVLLDSKQLFLEEYLNYKTTVRKEYPIVSEHLNNMETCPMIKAFSIPFFTKNPVRKKRGDEGYYNGICAPTYEMTPEECHFIKYETVLRNMYDFNYFSESDLSYLFKKSLALVLGDRSARTNC